MKVECEAKDGETDCQEGETGVNRWEWMRVGPSERSRDGGYVNKCDDE